MAAIMSQVTGTLPTLPGPGLLIIFCSPKIYTISTWQHYPTDFDLISLGAQYLTTLDNDKARGSQTLSVNTKILSSI